MAIKPDEQQTMVQPSNRLIREFRTDLPDPSDYAVQRFAATIGEAGETLAKSEAKNAAQTAAYSAPLGKDENGNYIKPEVPENFGLFARDVFNEIVTQRSANMAVTDFESFALKVRAEKADDPAGGAALIDANLKGRLAALPPEMRGRVEGAMMRERNQHVGTMELEHARKVERQTLEGIKTDVTSFTQKALDAAKVNTPEGDAQAAAHLNLVEQSIGALVAKRVLPENALTNFKETRIGIMAGGKIIAQVYQRLKENNLQEADLVDLERIVRSPWADENVLQIRSEDIRKTLTTDEARAAVATELRNMRGLLTKQFAENAEAAAINGVVEQVRKNGKAGMPIDMSDTLKEKTMRTWAQQEGLTVNGALPLTPQVLDRLQATFGELPKKSIEALFRNPNTLTPDEIEARYETFRHLNGMRTGSNDTTPAIGILNERDFAFMKQYQFARETGASPKAAYDSANDMLKRGKVETVSPSAVTEAVRRKYSAESTFPKETQDVEKLLRNYFPSDPNSVMGKPPVTAMSLAQRQTVLGVALQTMAYNENLKTAEAIEYAMKRFMTTHTYDPTIAGEGGMVGGFVPKTQAIPSIYDIKERSETARTTDYVKPYIDALLRADKDLKPAFNPADKDRLIPRNQGGWSLPMDDSQLKYGENIALKPIGVDTENPGFQLVYKLDNMRGWAPVQNNKRENVIVYLGDAAKKQDAFARELSLDYARSSALAEKMNAEQLAAGGTDFVAKPDSPRSGERPLGMIDVQSIIAPSPNANSRGTPGLKQQPGQRPMQLRDDGGEPILQRLGQFVVPGKTAAILNQVDQTFAQSMAAMVEAMPDEIRKGFFISSAYRTVEEQADIFAKHVVKYGTEERARKWAAPAGKSFHNHGKAMDLRFANTSVRDWVHQNAAQFGLHFPMKHEPWHIEPINARKMRSASLLDGDTEEAV